MDVSTELISISMLEYYKGSEVTIKVQEKEYNACHNSIMFNTAFNGDLKEGKEQKMTLDTSTGAFEIALKWMFTGAVGPKPETMSPSDYLAQLLEFSTLSDFLGLLGDLTPVTTEIYSILKTRGNLVSDHVKHAMKQGPGSEARKTVLKACIGPYLQSLGWSYDHNTPCTISKFRFRTELKGLDGFAAELFQLHDQIVRRRLRIRGQVMVPDPATGEKMYYK